MREPRAFYKDGGVFRENSKVCNVAYELLRSTTTNPLKPYASLDDVFYGAFKLGTFVSLEESKLDTNFAMLTSRYLVVFQPVSFEVVWSLSTADIMIPSRDAPNPVVEMNCMRVTLCDDE